MSITGSAVLASNPVIAGIVDRAPLKTGQTARCEGWNWRTPVDSERVTWFTSASSQPSVPVNARQIGSGASLTFDSNMLKDENGRYLICQVTGIQNGFESHFTASNWNSGIISDEDLKIWHCKTKYKLISPNNETFIITNLKKSTGAN